MLNSLHKEDRIMIYDYKLLRGDGTELDLASLKGKVILIVNTATGCGFTPQYEPIEEMYKKYHDKGLEILDIPCNQFRNQAPGSDQENHEFCQLHYNTTFAQMKKSDVNGPNELPLYTYLKEAQPFKGGGMMKMLGKLAKAKGNDIRWNFTKFVVNREGEVVKRFEPTEKIDKVEKFIISLL